MLGPAAAGNAAAAAVKTSGREQKQGTGVAPGPGLGPGLGLQPSAQDGPRDPVRDLVDAFRIKTEREKKLSRWSTPHNSTMIINHHH